MSEKRSFDAAISILALTHYRTDVHPNVQKIIDTAIRVLEAAGKVDKESCHLWLNHCFVSIEKTPEKDMKKMMEWAQTKSPSPKEQLSAMVEALPGKEKKCIGTY